MYALDAGCLYSMVGVRRKKKGTTRRTKEAKVTGMDDGLCIFIANQVIQRREMTPDVSNAKYSAMNGVY